MNTPNDFLYIVNLNSARDVDVERGIEEPSWEDFRNSLMNHSVRKFKDGHAFLPVMMKEEHLWELRKSKTSDVHHYRFDVNIEAITSLVVDIDKPGALEAAEQLFEGYEYVVYSTHNFTPETPWKYRLVARLADPIPIEIWGDCFDALKSRIEIDPSCRNPSRCYYYPSHSVNSHISPRAFYRLGKAISHEDILAFGREASKTNLSPTRLRTLGTMPIKSVRARRHFSGKVIGHYDRLPQVLSTERKDYEIRHAKSIQDYQADDSRHNLALSITSREYYMMGPRADLRSLLTFLYQVAAEGGKCLEQGNTPEELPEMIIGAMEKYAPEAYAKLISDYGDRSMSWIVGEVDWAHRNYASLNERRQAVVAQEVDVSYRVMRQRHAPFLREYVKSGDFAGLIGNILDCELRQEEPAFNDLAKALITYAKGYLTNVQKTAEPDIFSNVETLIRSSADSLKSDTGVANKIDQKKRTFMRSALLVELAKLRKKEVSNSPEP